MTHYNVTNPDYVIGVGRTVGIKANGAVTVVDKKGTLGPMDEVWNDPDRHIYATPDLFPK